MTASATQGPPSVVSRNRLGVSDLGRRLADQVGDTSRTDDHGVDPSALELSDVRASCDLDLRDCELAGGDVGQEIERRLERRFTVTGAPDREQEDLGV